MKGHESLGFAATAPMERRPAIDLTVMSEPSFRGNEAALGTSQESKRILPDTQVEQLVGSINLMDLAGSYAPAGHDPEVCKAKGRITELLGENR